MPTPDDRARLEALRANLEAVLADPGIAPRDLATVAREYRQTLEALAKLAPPAKGTPADEIAQRRRRRKAAAS